jgi:hypothetical protein
MRGNAMRIVGAMPMMATVGGQDCENLLKYLVRLLPDGHHAVRTHSQEVPCMD